MGHSFTAYSHKNILATHKTTIEFTKDKELSLRGNCILGVNADFDLTELKKLIINKDKPIKNKIKIIICVGDISDEIAAELNPDFDDDKEIVIRMGEFRSKRTLGVRADKGAAHIKRELVEKLKNSKQEIKVLITDI